MARLVITQDHIEHAAQEMERTDVNQLFGGRVWENRLTSHHSAAWMVLVSHLPTAGNTIMRRVLTMVCDVVMAARGGTLPQMGPHDWNTTFQKYVPMGTIATKVQYENASEDLFDLMYQHHPMWAYLFADQVAHESLSVNEKFALSCFAIMVMQAQLLESPLEAPMAETEKEKRAAVPTIEPILDTGITFDMIGGFPAIKKEFQYLAKMINQPEALAKCGLQSPRGVLLIGPPGVGKTMFVRALATAVSKPYYEISQTKISSSYINFSAQMFEAFFEQVRAAGGGILFFDEAESLLVPRGSRQSHMEDTKVVAAFNRCLDRPSVPDGIIVIIAANKEDLLDDASTRTGRMDRIIRFGLPDASDRREVLRKHMQEAQKRAGDDRLFAKDLKWSPHYTVGFSCSDLAEVIRRVLEPKGRDVLDGKPFTPVTSDELRQAMVQISQERKKKVVRQIGFGTPEPPPLVLVSPETPKVAGRS